MTCAGCYGRASSASCGGRDREGGRSQKSAREVTIVEASKHFACLYIKYVQIFRKLEECYDGMIHPQKRLQVKEVLELVIRRISELRNDLVKWNPPTSYLQMPTGPEVAFPWEYVHLDDILVDLKLSPETLELPVPKYFKEDQSRIIEQRDRLVSGYMRLKHNTDEIFIEDTFGVAKVVEGMTIDRAIEIIQRTERGRQGSARATMVRDLRESERNSRMYDATAQMEMDTDIASTNIQRMVMGHASRRIAKKQREEELQFVAMSARPDNVDNLKNEMEVAYRKRKQEQAENKEIYERALDELKDITWRRRAPRSRRSYERKGPYG